MCFEILVPREIDTELMRYEIYADDEAFELHRDGTSIAQWQAESAGLVARLDVTKCEPAQ